MKDVFFSHKDGLQVNVDVSASGVRVAGLNGITLEIGMRRFHRAKIYHRVRIKWLDGRKAAASSMKRSERKPFSSRGDWFQRADCGLRGRFAKGPVEVDLEPLDSGEQPRCCSR